MYPIGSKWRWKANDTVYTIKELHFGGLYMVAELEEEGGRNLLYEPCPSMHMNFERL